MNNENNENKNYEKFIIDLIENASDFIKKNLTNICSFSVTEVTNGIDKFFNSKKEKIKKQIPDVNPSDDNIRF